MTEPTQQPEPAEDNALSTIIETASFDDGTEALDYLEDVQGQTQVIPGAKTP